MPIALEHWEFTVRLVELVAYTSRVPQLHENLAALGVHGFRNLLPAFDLSRVEDTRCTVVTPSGGTDVRALSDEETAIRSSLRVELDDDSAWDAIVARTESSHGSQNNAVLELNRRLLATERRRCEDFGERTKSHRAR